MASMTIGLVRGIALPDYKSGVWKAVFIVSAVLAMLTVSVSVYAIALGGNISEKLIGRSGVGSSSLLIGRDGLADSGLDLGISGIAVPTGATDVYMDGAGTHATLNGNLQTLNGFPQVTVYFEWGYDMTYGNTTAAQVVMATGAFSDGIAHFDPSQTVYYRTVVEADGTNYSSPTSFTAEGGIVAGFNLLNAVVLIAYIAMVLFAMIVIGRQSTIAALMLMAVAIYIGEAFVVAIQEAIRRIF